MSSSAAHQDGTYTGHVEPRGPAATRDLPELTVTKMSVGPMDNNAYLLTCKATGEAVLIDAADDDDRLLDLIGPDRPLRAVVTTATRCRWATARSR